MPYTKDVLLLDTNCASYQSCIWKSALQPEISPLQSASLVRIYTKGAFTNSENVNYGCKTAIQQDAVLAGERNRCVLVFVRVLIAHIPLTTKTR